VSVRWYPKSLTFLRDLSGPKSLTGQVWLTLAGALLLAQAIGAVLLYKAQAEYREAGLTHQLAMRTSWRLREKAEKNAPDAEPGAKGAPDPDTVAEFVPEAGDIPNPSATERLKHILSEQEIEPAQLLVVDRALAKDTAWAKRMEQRFGTMGKHRPDSPEKVLLAAVRPVAGAPWELVRVWVPKRDPWLLTTLITQTLFIYAALVGAMALILRRIARPLQALTSRVSVFAETRNASGQIVPEGPDDVRLLIEAHNAMEQRIIALIKEKDVMLGAIGHDLKTPLSALRVRIESVEDDGEREKMAQTIEDIVRSLDDILSLARVGRSSDPVEANELSALIGAIVEEYEDMGQPVTMADMARLVLPLRATWLQRALRNLIDNALRYGQGAAVSLEREDGFAVIRVVDQGDGIPEAQIEDMFEPFTRGDPSRNSTTGGAGLGLTLARAIAQQHGGQLTLANRVVAGKVAGLVATLRLPISA
jgi:signal transduction histidine kinase